MSGCGTDLWLKRRAELGHPLGVAESAPHVAAGRVNAEGSSVAADLVVEIGCEELPPADIQTACQQLRCSPPPFPAALALSSTGDVTTNANGDPGRRPLASSRG